MATIKIKWSAKAEGVEEVDLDDLELTLDEWNELDSEEQKSIVEGVIGDSYDTIAYGVVDNWSIEE